MYLKDANVSMRQHPAYRLLCSEVLTVIKPVPELVEAIRNKILSRSEVEPWVDCICVLAAD